MSAFDWDRRDETTKSETQCENCAGKRWAHRNRDGTCLDMTEPKWVEGSFFKPVVEATAEQLSGLSGVCPSCHSAGEHWPDCATSAPPPSLLARPAPPAYTCRPGCSPVEPCMSKEASDDVVKKHGLDSPLLCRARRHLKREAWLADVMWARDAKNASALPQTRERPATNVVGVRWNGKAGR